MEASWWEMTFRKLVLVLMGGAMLSKSLIQFSVDQWGCVPLMLFDWDKTMVEVMKIMTVPLKRSYVHTATLRASYPVAGHFWPASLLETVGQSQVSLGQSLVGHCFFSWKKIGKLNSGHRTGKCQFSFQSQRKAMPKNSQTTTQLHSSHILIR